MKKTEHYKSFYEFVGRQDVREWVESDKFTRSSSNDMSKYLGELDGLLSESDPKGLVAEFLKVRQQLKPEAVALTTVYDVMGDYVDMGRFVTGEPECMVDYHYDSAIKFLDVEISIGRPWIVENYQAMEYYNNILNIIDALEANGFRCKITVVTHWVQLLKGTYTPSGREYRAIIELKNYEEVLDYKTFALLVLDNDFMSHFIIPYTDRCKHYVNQTKTIGLDLLDAENIRNKQTQDKIYLPCMYHRRFGSSITNTEARYYKNIPSSQEIIHDIGIGYLFNQ